MQYLQSLQYPFNLWMQYLLRRLLLLLRSLEQGAQRVRMFLLQQLPQPQPHRRTALHFGAIFQLRQLVDQQCQFPVLHWPLRPLRNHLLL